MNSLAFMVFSVLVVLVFFGIGITCMAIWFKSFAKTREILRSPTEHWSVKGAIYYGAYFAIFIVSSVFISFVVIIAYILWSGIV